MHKCTSLFPHLPGPHVLEQHTGSGRGVCQADTDGVNGKTMSWAGGGRGSDVGVLCEWLFIKLSFVYKGSLLNTRYVVRLIHAFNRHSLSTCCVQALCWVLSLHGGPDRSPPSVWWGRNMRQEEALLPRDEGRALCGGGTTVGCD